MAEEKSPSHGSTSVTFGMLGKIPGQTDYIFVTLNKFKSPGKYVPIYKSEVKTPLIGKYKWNVLTIDTHTLCDNNFE